MSRLDNLNEQIRRCRVCPLSEGRTHAVPGEGPNHARIVLVGEAPGKQEDREGRPFVGRAGQLLDTLLESIGLTREQLYVTNIIKCRPPDNRDPKAAEIAACRAYLEQQLELIQPKIIVTLGRHALTWFLPRAQVSKVHGKMFQVGSALLMPTLHPAAALRFVRWQEIIEADFQRLRHTLEELNLV